jgi:type IV secretory pathway TraG/TraD family ATPase VirD4
LILGLSLSPLAVIARRGRASPIVLDPHRFRHAVPGFAPARKLLTSSAPCIVLDPGGRLYRLTSKHRRRVFHHATPRIDPWDIVRRHPGWTDAPPPDSLNPCESVESSSPALLDWTGDLASAIVVRDQPTLAESPFWDDSAELFLSNFIAAILTQAPQHERNLSTLRHLAMMHREAPHAMPELIGKCDAFHPMIRRRAIFMSYYTDRELLSTMTTCGRHTAFLDSERIDACLRSTSFDTGRLIDPGDMTLYLCFPANAPVRLQRLLLVSLQAYVSATELQDNHRVLFVCGDPLPLLTAVGGRLFDTLHQLLDIFHPNQENVDGR